MGFLRRHRGLQGAILIGPAALWALAFIVVPTFMAVRMSFWRMENFQLVRHWSLDNYSLLLDSQIYRDGLVRSLENGFIASVAAVALSIPLAHFIRFHVHRHRTLFVGGVVVALWLGYLLRIFGWRILFGTSGVLNSFLMSVGITDHPLQFLIFSPLAVAVTQTHLAMPFAFIPIFAAMERLPANVMEAGGDLGASRRRQFLFIELPLISRGVVVGGTFAFILAFGDYFAPVFVGAPSASTTLGNLAANNFRATINWPFGAAIGVVMMITILVVLSITEIVTRKVASDTGGGTSDRAEAVV
ncbi:MAG: ABC transporter permease [Gaiellales bacterium]